MSAVRRVPSHRAIVEPVVITLLGSLIVAKVENREHHPEFGKCCRAGPGAAGRQHGGPARGWRSACVRLALRASSALSCPRRPLALVTGFSLRFSVCLLDVLKVKPFFS